MKAAKLATLDLVVDTSKMQEQGTDPFLINLYSFAMRVVLGSLTRTGDLTDLPPGEMEFSAIMNKSFLGDTPVALENPNELESLLLSQKEAVSYKIIQPYVCDHARLLQGLGAAKYSFERGYDCEVVVYEEGAKSSADKLSGKFVCIDFLSRRLNRSLYIYVKVDS